jgi:hypothetical protein
MTGPTASADRIDADLRAFNAHDYPFYWCLNGFPCWSPDGTQITGLVDNLRLVGGSVDDGRFALVFTKADGTMVRTVDLKKLGFLYVGSIDWR